MILNLKYLNIFIPVAHCKFEDHRTVQKLLTRDCFFSYDRPKRCLYVDTYSPFTRKCLRFMFNNVLYEFTCLPFGLCTAPLVFTKLVNPVSIIWELLLCLPRECASDIFALKKPWFSNQRREKLSGAITDMSLFRISL